MSLKHTIRIVGEEDALLLACEGEGVDGVLGIYEDMATKCPRCGEMLVLRMGGSYAEAIQPTPEPTEREEAAGLHFPCSCETEHDRDCPLHGDDCLAPSPMTPKYLLSPPPQSQDRATEPNGWLDQIEDMAQAGEMGMEESLTEIVVMCRKFRATPSTEHGGKSDEPED